MCCLARDCEIESARATRFTLRTITRYIGTEWSDQSEWMHRTCFLLFKPNLQLRETLKNSLTVANLFSWSEGIALLSFSNWNKTWTFAWLHSFFSSFMVGTYSSSLLLASLQTNTAVVGSACIARYSTVTQSKPDTTTDVRSQKRRWRIKDKISINGFGGWTSGMLTTLFLAITLWLYRQKALCLLLRHQRWYAMESE